MPPSDTMGCLIYFPMMKKLQAASAGTVNAQGVLDGVQRRNLGISRLFNVVTEY